MTTLTSLEDFRSLTKQEFRIVFVAVDGDREAAMKTIEYVCSSGSAIAMAYSPSTNDDLLINCIRAGVREFLVYPFAPAVVEDAFSRANSRGMLSRIPKKVVGKIFVFIGAKGGSGGTTAACNFASLDGQGFEEGNAADRPRLAAGRCGSRSWELPANSQLSMH